MAMCPNTFVHGFLGRGWRYWSSNLPLPSRSAPRCSRTPWSPPSRTSRWNRVREQVFKRWIKRNGAPGGGREPRSEWARPSCPSHRQGSAVAPSWDSQPERWFMIPYQGRPGRPGRVLGVRSMCGATECGSVRMVCGARDPAHSCQSMGGSLGVVSAEGALCVQPCV